MSIALVYVVLLGLLLLARRYHESWWGRELFRSYGAKTTGPFGSYTRRDFARGALLSGMAAIVCLVMMTIGFWFGDRYPVNSKPEQFALIYAFVFTLLFLLAGVSSLILLGKAAVAKPFPDYPYAILASDQLIGFSAFDESDPATRRLAGDFVPWSSRAAKRFLQFFALDQATSEQTTFLVITRNLEPLLVERAVLEGSRPEEFRKPRIEVWLDPSAPWPAAEPV